MRGARCFIVRGLAPLLCLAATGCGASGDAVVATVAGAPVHSKLLEHWTTVELDAGAGGSETGAKRLALDLLISWEWVAGEAQALHVNVKASEARKQLGLSQTSRNTGIAGFEWFPGEAAMRRFLDSPKISQQDELMLVRMGMLTARVGARQTALAEAKVPRSSIVAYFERHRRLFHVGERRDIKAIMNKDRAKVIEAKHEMEHHVPFHLVAERFNTSIEGGLRLGRAWGAHTKRYERDYFSVPTHRLVGPLHEVLYYIFEVMRIRPGHPMTLAEVEPTIRRRLAAQHGVAAEKRAYEQRWRAMTVCETGFDAARCGSFSSQPG